MLPANPKNERSGHCSNIGILLMALIVLPSAHADDIPKGTLLSSGIGTAIDINGTVVAPMPCTINGDIDQQVSFGKTVILSEINGTYDTQSVPAVLQCTESTSGSMTLLIQGQKMPGVLDTGNDNVVRTSLMGLGIALRKDGENIPLNQWIDFDTQQPLNITATPVINQKLPPQTGGDFTATIVLEVRAD